jgi:hypothetical protein
VPVVNEKLPALYIEPAFLDVHSAAIFIGLRPRTLDRWRWAGTGPPYRRHGGRVVYAVADLLEWSDKQASLKSSAAPGAKK